jgi:hypothetical protein
MFRTKENDQLKENERLRDALAPLSYLGTTPRHGQEDRASRHVTSHHNFMYVCLRDRQSVHFQDDIAVM